MKGITLGQCAFTDLDFADDMSLLAELLELLVPGLEIFQEEAAPLGLEANWQKTMVRMTLGGQGQMSRTSLPVFPSVGTMSNVWNHLST